MPEFRLAGLCGALRAPSTNRKLMHEAKRLFDPAAFDEGDLRQPLYDGDVEEAEGIPASVETLAALIRGADAVIIATPEYNRAPPGLLKNALDWLSRVKDQPLVGKPVAIMSAAGGPGGGDRSQFALRLMLVPFRPRLLIGPEFVLPASSEAFDEAGKLKDPKRTEMLGKLMEALRDEIRRAA